MAVGGVDSHTTCTSALQLTRDAYILACNYKCILCSHGCFSQQLTRPCHVEIHILQAAVYTRKQHCWRVQSIQYACDCAALLVSLAKITTSKALLHHGVGRTTANHSMHALLHGGILLEHFWVLFRVQTAPGGPLVSTGVPRDRSSGAFWSPPPKKKCIL